MSELQINVQAKQVVVTIRDGENKLEIRDGDIIEYNDRDMAVGIDGGCTRSVDEVLRNYDLTRERLLDMIVLMTL